MPKERAESGQYQSTVAPGDVLDVFDAVRGPIVTSADVADALGVTRETARRKLTALADDGTLAHRKTAGRVVYWRTDDTGAERGREPAVTPPGEPADRSDPPAADPREPGQESALDDALAGWEPDTEADAKSARGQTRRTVEYLREHAPERFQAGELKDALAGESAFSPRHWWERVVQPGLKHLADAGLVEYRAGHHDYRWVGGDGDA